MLKKKELNLEQLGKVSGGISRDATEQLIKLQEYLCTYCIQTFARDAIIDKEYLFFHTTSDWLLATVLEIDKSSYENNWRFKIRVKDGFFFGNDLDSYLSYDGCMHTRPNKEGYTLRSK